MGKVRTIIIVVSLLILILYFQMLFRYPKVESLKYNYTDVSQILKDANNGDLIFMGGDTYGERICRYCSDCPFSHVGMLFREPDSSVIGSDNTSKLYIWDCDLGQGYREGPRVMLFQDKLNRYKGFHIGAYRKFRGERPKLEDILKIISEYTNHTFDHLMVTWLTSRFKFIHTLLKKDKQVFCSELIAITLRKLGIITKKDKVDSWYTPGWFFNDKSKGGLRLYDIPILFKFTPEKDE